MLGEGDAGSTTEIVGAEGGNGTTPVGADAFAGEAMGCVDSVAEDTSVREGMVGAGRLDGTGAEAPPPPPPWPPPGSTNWADDWASTGGEGGDASTAATSLGWEGVGRDATGWEVVGGRGVAAGGDGGVALSSASGAGMLRAESMPRRRTGWGADGRSDGRDVDPTKSDISVPKWIDNRRVMICDMGGQQSEGVRVGENE